MHCLSCPASQMESLAEACEVHGIDVDELVKELNKE
jgi:hydroxylamine reductase